MVHYGLCRQEFLFIKFICDLGLNVRTRCRDFIPDICGLDPIYRILDNLLNVRIIERTAELMAGLEIEYLACAAKEAATASEDESILIPTSKNKSIRLRNIERLAVKLLLIDDEMIGNTCGYGMRGHEIPDYLFLITTPGEISGSSDNILEYL